MSSQGNGDNRRPSDSHQRDRARDDHAQHHGYHSRANDCGPAYIEQGPESLRDAPPYIPSIPAHVLRGEKFVSDFLGTPEDQRPQDAPPLGPYIPDMRRCYSGSAYPPALGALRGFRAMISENQPSLGRNSSRPASSSAQSQMGPSTMAPGDNLPTAQHVLPRQSAMHIGTTNMNSRGNHQQISTPPAGMSHRGLRNENSTVSFLPGTPLRSRFASTSQFMDMGNTPRASQASRGTLGSSEQFKTPQPPKTPMNMRSQTSMPQQSADHGEGPFRQTLGAASASAHVGRGNSSSSGQLVLVDDRHPPADPTGLDDVEMNQMLHAPLPIKAIIKGDGVDILHPKVILRLRKSCANGYIMSTPHALCSRHQLDLADVLFYNHIWNGRFMVNDAYIIEYHNPLQMPDNLGDPNRRDRRVSYAWVKKQDGECTWCHVIEGKKIYAVSEKEPKPSEFPDVLNLKKYIFERLPNIDIAQYARYIAPQFIDNSPEADGMNGILVGMYPNAGNAAALVVATKEEVIRAHRAKSLHAQSADAVKRGKTSVGERANNGEAGVSRVGAESVTSGANHKSNNDMHDLIDFSHQPKTTLRKNRLTSRSVACSEPASAFAASNDAFANMQVPIASNAAPGDEKSSKAVDALAHREGPVIQGQEDPVTTQSNSNVLVTDDSSDSELSSLSSMSSLSPMDMDLDSD